MNEKRGELFWRGSLILLYNLVFYCFKGAKYSTLLPSFFYVYLCCCLGVVFIISSMPVHVLATVQSPLDVCVRLVKDHRTLFTPCYGALFSPICKSCLPFYYFVREMLYIFTFQLLG